MLGGVQKMPMGDAGMMRALFVVAGFMVLGRFAMMPGRVFVMVGGHFMVFVDVVAIHRRLPHVSRDCDIAALPGSVKQMRRRDGVPAKSKCQAESRRDAATSFARSAAAAAAALCQSPNVGCR